MLKVATFFAILAAANAGAIQPHVAYSHGVVSGAAPVAYHAAAPAAVHYAAAPAVTKYHAAPAIAKVHAAPAVYAAPAHTVVKSAPAVVAKTVVAEEYDANPQYSYGYSVQDGLTGDNKGHQESRDGDVVQGQYSLVEPDGAVRTVTYTSDPVNGFNAVVDRSAPAVVAAPAVAKVHAAPAVYAAHQPVLKTHHLV